MTAAEVRRIHAEGRASAVGDANPYFGDRIRASVWRGGYQQMLDAMLANSPARQPFLRAQRLRRHERHVATRRRPRR